MVSPPSIASAFHLQRYELLAAGSSTGKRAQHHGKPHGGARVCLQDVASITDAAQVGIFRATELFHHHFCSSLIEGLMLKKIWERSSGPDVVTYCI